MAYLWVRRAWGGNGLHSDDYCELHHTIYAEREREGEREGEGKREIERERERERENYIDASHRGLMRCSEGCLQNVHALSNEAYYRNNVILPHELTHCRTTWREEMAEKWFMFRCIIFIIHFNADSHKLCFQSRATVVVKHLLDRCNPVHTKFPM